MKWILVHLQPNGVVRSIIKWQHQIINIYLRGLIKIMICHEKYCNKASPWPINPITNSSHPSYPPLQVWGTTGYRDQLIHIPHPSFLYRYKCKGLLIVATWINHYIYVWLHIQIFCLYTSMVTSMQVKILKKSAGHAHKNIRRTWTGFTANANKLFRLICTIICILETKTIM